MKPETQQLLSELEAARKKLPGMVTLTGREYFDKQAQILRHLAEQLAVIERPAK